MKVFMPFSRVLSSLIIGGCLLGVFAPPIVSAQAPYRESAQAPAHWGQFAKLVKFRFEEWVSADDPIADRFRAYLKTQAGASDGPPASLVVRAWLNPDGSVERVAFAAFADDGATRDLQSILTRGNVGEAPPPEMLQPLHLRFSLTPGK
jgi:hypothetical protein